VYVDILSAYLHVVNKFDEYNMCLGYRSNWFSQCVK